MAIIKVHGLLGNIFGNTFNINVNSGISAIRAIDANREGFFKKICDLGRDGNNYHIIINGQAIESEAQFIEKRIIKNIDIIPAIFGSGTAIVTAIAGQAFAKTITGIIIAGVLNMAISAAISIGVALIMSAMQKSAAPPQSYVAIGGSVAAIESKSKSYIFSNYQNTASQGSAIPLGYGRMKVSSHLINSSIKDYLTNTEFQNEVSLNQNQSIFSHFLAS